MEHHVSDFILQFMAEYYSDFGLEHIMKTAYKFFDNPCALYDMSYKTIAYIGEGDSADQIWTETVRDGYLSEKTLSYFMSENLLSPQHKVLYPCFTPTIFEANTGISKRLGVALSSESKTLTGWFVVFERNRPISDMDMELCAWIAKMLVPEMEAFISKKTFSLGRIDNLMLDILNNSADLATIEERLRLLGWELAEPSRVLVVKSEEISIPEPMQEYIASRIEAKTGSVVRFIYNGYFVLVINTPNDMLRDSMSDELENTLQKFDLYAGVSAPITSIAKLRHYCLQAINCMRVGQAKGQGRRLFFFKDFTIDILLLTASSFFDISEFCHPIILKLHEYDQNNNTDYLETLRKYVFCNGNLKAAAKELWIHRNTMSYRMEKLLEIIGLKALDQKLFTELQISFAIDDIASLDKNLSLDS